RRALIKVASACTHQAVLVEVGVGQAGIETVIAPVQHGGLAGLVIDHFHFRRAPELVLVLLVAGHGQRLQQAFLAVVVINFLHAVLGVVHPHHLAGVTGILVGGVAFGDE